MTRARLLGLSILFCAGIAFLTVRYIKMSSQLEVAFQAEVQTKPQNEKLESKVEKHLTFKELQQEIELSKSERAFLDRLEQAQLGEELFWSIQLNILKEEGHSQYQLIHDELLGNLRANNQKALTSILQVLKDFPPLEYSLEKLQLLKLINLCGGPPELVKEISLYMLETELVQERLDPEKAKNNEEVSLAFSNGIHINVQLTAHALYMDAVDSLEGWQGTKASMQAQRDPWIKSRLAQQYVQKWPSQRELIRHELIALLREQTNRQPANESFDEEPQE